MSEFLSHADAQEFTWAIDDDREEKSAVIEMTIPRINLLTSSTFSRNKAPGQTAAVNSGTAGQSSTQATQVDSAGEVPSVFSGRKGGDEETTARDLRDIPLSGSAYGFARNGARPVGGVVFVLPR
ncbi:hypothetical protein [Streptomyces sp. SBT349]|uniref:hypothetical protein n=1 Tax=Streptomyces sp. SBT349 TaxID=1580539 RepID=UPI00131EBFA9|nr:hypothetical protein [Streptomyces sp. SBT349]